jgi:nucleotide-binding universal stress UspA family protein
MYSRILVPLDGSDTAAQGLREAITLARVLKSTLVLLHVVNEYPLLVDMAGVTGSDEFRRDLLHFGKELLAKGCREAEQAGVRVESVMHEITLGRVGDVISEAAKAQQCQLIVMGTHGRRGISRLTMGSDAEITVRCAPVPVLLVRQQGAER